jgi:hypothetical protein
MKSCPKDGHLGSSFMLSTIGMGFSLLDFSLYSLSEDCCCIITFDLANRTRRIEKEEHYEASENT